MVLVLMWLHQTLVSSYTILPIGSTLYFEQSNASSWQHYLILPCQEATPISISATVIYGDVDVYVHAQHFVNTTNCSICISSTGPFGEIIPTICPSNNSLFISVFTITSTSLFSLSCFSSRLFLENGHPLIAQASNYDTLFVDYLLDSPSNLTISVSPLVGDPDLVVSIENPYPSYLNHSWFHERVGYDILTIDTRDTDYRSPATYHIGAFAFPNSTFVITATKSQDYTLLLEGISLSGSLPLQYFKFVLPEEKTLSFLVVPQHPSSQPHIFITYNVAEPKPSATNYHFKAIISEFGSVSLTIHNASIGTYYIAVTEDSKSDFQIVATSEQGHVLLRDGFDVTGVLEPNKYQYFKYFHNDDESDVQIEATGLSGLLNMYVARNNPRPSAEPGKYDYEGSEMGAVQYVSIPAPLSLGLYYIGIVSNYRVSYSVVVNTRQSYSILREGMTNFYNRVNQGYYRYFIFDMARWDEEIIITANPWVGNTDLFISMSNPFPTQNNFSWSSEREKQDSVVIAPSEFTPGLKRFYVGVYAKQMTQFSILAITSNTTTPLVDGIPYRGAVKQGKYRYYKVYNPYTSGVAIELMVDEPHDADLYVSKITEKPSPMDYEYKSDNAGKDVIRIDNVLPGWLYIAVHGYLGHDVQYKISATLDYRVLANNQDVYAFSPQNQNRVFIGSVLPGCDFVLATVRNIYGKAYLSLDSNYTATPLKWFPTFKNAQVQAILVAKNDAHFRTGFWTVGVHGHTAADYITKFSCMTMTGAMNLNSAPTIAVIPQNYTTIYYEQYLASRSAYISINILYGSVKIDVIAHERVIFSTKSNATSIIRTPGSETVKIKLTKLSSVEDIAVVDLVFTSAIGPFALAMGQSFQLKQEDEREHAFKFKVYNSRSTSHSMRMTIESCDNFAATPFCTNADHYPMDCSYSMQSRAVSSFVQELVFPPNSAIPYYYVAGNSSSVLFRVDAIDPIKPLTRASRTIDGGAENEELLKLYIKDPFISNSSAFSIRLRPVGPFHTSDFNFETFCVLQNAVQLPIMQLNRKGDQIELIATAPSTGIKYVLNVLASNERAEAVHIFEPVWYLNGVIYPMYQYVRVPISIGMLIIGIVLHIMVMYCVCGCFCNRVCRKKRGWQVIPHYTFWKELPFYVWEGFSCIVCCPCCCTNHCFSKMKYSSTASSELIEQCVQDEFSTHITMAPQKYGFGAGK